LLGARWPDAGASPLWTTLTFLLAGILVALDARVRDAGIPALAILAGLAQGFANGATMGALASGGVVLGGAVTAVFCVIAILPAEVSALPAGWPRIAVRIARSWIAVAGVLMLGWLARTTA